MLATPTARERRFHDGFACPRCRAHEVQRWGRERSGVQRYRCLACRRTFNDLTGFAMAGTRLPAHWEQYAEAMRQSLSCRRAAALLDVNHKTVWRWRHRVMAQLAPAEPLLSGIVEADETFFRRNFKRLKPVGRRKRKRGTAAGNPRGLGKDKVPVLIARSRSGETRSAVLPGTATREALATALRGMVDPASTLCTDGSGALRAAAQEVGVRKHVALVAARGERKRGIYHVQSVNSYQGRLKQWLAPFRGVATKYLHRYLAWHVIHERVSRLSPRAARRVLVGNSAELAAARCCPNCGAALAA